MDYTWKLKQTEYIMAKCKQCNITIRDDTQVCPLCRCVAEPEDHGITTYPNVRMTQRRLKHLSNICLFCLLLASALLAVLNYEFYNGTLWCLIPIAAMCYGYLVLRYAILSQHGYRSKIGVLVFCGIALVIIIDSVTGFHRWSVNYIFPSGLMLADLIILLLMLINIRAWQSYIILQLAMILLSLTPLVLWRLGVITSPLLSFIALGISFFLFLGTVIIGDRRARVELKRRFHIR